MIQSPTGLIHAIAASIALVAGLFVFARPRSTTFHRTMAYIYGDVMAVVVVTAFSIYHLTKSFNLLHVATILSCFPLIIGIVAALGRRPKDCWLRIYYYWMSWSYVLLCAAFFAEIATRIMMPYLSSHFEINSALVYAAIVGFTSLFVVVLGWRLVERNRRIVAGFQSHEPT
ncbi:MAG: hypothetical protein JWP08_777 [Bryobacterales bacterium]|nr:hypothetical protein [Bryobacterales bacterium]